MLIVAFQARVESSSIPENNANTLVSASSQPSTNVLYCTHCMPFYSEEQSVITCQHGVDVLGDIVLSVNTTMLKVFNLSFCHWLKWSFIILEIRLLSLELKSGQGQGSKMPYFKATGIRGGHDRNQPLLPLTVNEQPHQRFARS